MKKNLIFMIGIFILFLSAVYADYPKTEISRAGGLGPDYSNEVEFLKLHNKKILVYWTQGPRENSASIYYRILDREANKWSPPLSSLPWVLNNKLYSSGYPRVVQDTNGGLHLAIHDGTYSGNRDVYYRYYEGYDDNGKIIEDTSRRKRFQDRANSAWPSIALDPETNDVYIGWHHPHTNTPVYTGSDIVYYKKIYSTGKWTTSRRGLSKAPNDTSIHPCFAFTYGQLHGVWQNGGHGDWRIRGNYADPDGIGPSEAVDVPGAGGGYWPELKADSQGTVVALYTNRNSTISYSYKPLNMSWKAGGELNAGGEIGFFGIDIAGNDVVYTTYRRPGPDGFLATLAIFTPGNEPIKSTVTEGTRFIGRIKLLVDDDGAIHMAWVGRGNRHDENSSIMYKRLDPPSGAPKVRITNPPDVVMTNENVTFKGEVVSSTSPIANHRWRIIGNLPYGKAGQEITTIFTEPGTFEVHYFVSDENYKLGHDSVIVEVLDVPFQPTNESISTAYVKGFLFRGYFNQLNWTNDSRNDEKFPNTTHYNVYRRADSSSEWNKIGTMPFTSSSERMTYVDSSLRFTTETDIEADTTQYGVTVVADVNGAEKESKKAIIKRSGGTQTSSDFKFTRGRDKKF